MAENPSLVGIKEIAEIAGVSRQTAANWPSRRRDFPKPYQKLGSGTLYRRDEVERWCKRRKEEGASGSKTISMKGDQKAVDGEVLVPSELGQQLIDLGIVRQNEWDEAVKKTEKNADPSVILQRLTELNRADEGASEVIPVLTDYQRQEIINHRTRELRIGNYILLDRIGKGGTGTVFKARNPQLARIEAIKILNFDDDEQSNKQRKKRFLREQKLLTKLRHPRLPIVHCAGQDHDRLYLAMDYLEGEDLAKRIECNYSNQTQIELGTVLGWMIDLVEVLTYAHGKHLVHRDIKPENIFLTNDGEIKLLDLGLGLFVGGSTITAAGTCLGTPSVMPPEQWDDPREATPNSDIYSLGCTFFQILTGREPFPVQGRTREEYREAHKKNPRPAPSSIRYDVPAELDRIIQRMMAIAPKQRYGAKDLLRVLKQFSEQRNAGSHTESSRRFLSLQDWPAKFSVRTAIVGDRREDPPKNIADVLARSASTGDLFYFGELGIPARIRSDKITKFATNDSLTKILHGDILVIGSPAANLMARVVNRFACFRFALTQEAKQLEKAFELALQQIAFAGDDLEEYFTHSSKEGMQRIRELNSMKAQFAKAGFVDPVDFNGIRGFSTRTDEDYGVISLCKHPWNRNGVAILVGGIHGPGTAAAVKLITTPDAFIDRPLGGVFKIRVPQEARWEDRYDMLRPKWDTHPYTTDKYEADLKAFISRLTAGEFRDVSLDEQPDFGETLEFLQLLKSRNPLQVITPASKG
jgi:serine/threonine protein kinase/predicted DNA-binding transcriptional regulator AlpA